MTVEQLRHFLGVAQSLNFTRAASQLNITQPALSRSIRCLEEELGVILFDRSKRLVVATRAGNLLQPIARRIIEQDKRARELTLKAASSKHHLTLSFCSDALHAILPEVLEWFAVHQPSVQVHLHESHDGFPDQEFAQGAVQLGIYPASPRLDPRLESVLLRRDPIMLAIPEHDELALWPEIRIRDLAEKQLLLFPRSYRSSLYDRLKAELSGPNVIEAEGSALSSDDSRLRLVTTGFGCTIVSEALVQADYRRVVFRPIVDLADEMLDLSLVWSREQNSFKSLFQELGAHLVRAQV